MAQIIWAIEPTSLEGGAGKRQTPSRLHGFQAGLKFPRIAKLLAS